MKFFILRETKAGCTQMCILDFKRANCDKLKAMISRFTWLETLTVHGKVLMLGVAKIGDLTMELQTNSLRRK